LGRIGDNFVYLLCLLLKAKDEVGLVPNMHLTCTNMEVSMIENALKSCKENGLCNILALRGSSKSSILSPFEELRCKHWILFSASHSGDPPAGQVAWTAAGGGFNCALDLVKFIKNMDADNFFCISVSGNVFLLC
jgi:methylenetetrahydrofolate reductase (NADPH)